MRNYIYQVILLLVMLFAPGCTMTFKGKDIEMEAEAVKIYELESIGIFESPARGVIIKPMQFAKK